MVPPIAILGAGPSGLMLGRLLEVAKIEYIIFERDQSPDPTGGQGGTLDLHPGSGQLALEEAGLLDNFKKLARFDGSTRLANGKGELLVDLGADEPNNDRPEIDRRQLRAMLLESVPAEKIQWGKRVELVKKDESGLMSVSFEDGSVESGFKLVVGADGAWSKARSLVTSAVPEYSGFHFLTGHVKPSNPQYGSVESLAGKGNYMAFGHGQFFLAMRLGDDSYHTGFCQRLPEDWSKQNPVSTRQAVVQSYFSGWPDQHTKIIRNVDGEFRSWPLYSMPTESLNWKSVPGVALIGDAAHVTTPFEGEGVNCALFDSVQLAQKIRQHGMDNLYQAVAEYEQEMFPRAIKLIKGSAEQGESFFEPDAPKKFLQKIGIECN